MIDCSCRCFAATASSIRRCSVTSRALPVPPITLPSPSRSVAVLKLSVTRGPVLAQVLGLVLAVDSPPSRAFAAVSRSRRADLRALEVRERPPDHLLGLVAVDLSHGVVHEGEAVVLVDGPDHVLGGLNDLAVLLLALQHGALGLLQVGHVEHQALHQELAVLAHDHGGHVAHPEHAVRRGRPSGTRSAAGPPGPAAGPRPPAPRSRSSGWIVLIQAPGSAVHSSGLQPSICSTWALTNDQCPSAPKAAV